MRTVRVRYTCGMCHAIERGVDVAERTALQDAVQWVRGVVAPTVANDHSRTSPLCRSTKMKWLKLPLPNGTVELGKLP